MGVWVRVWFKLWVRVGAGEGEAVESCLKQCARLTLAQPNQSEKLNHLDKDRPVKSDWCAAPDIVSSQ